VDRLRKLPATGNNSDGSGLFIEDLMKSEWESLQREQTQQQAQVTLFVLVYKFIGAVLIVIGIESL